MRDRALSLAKITYVCFISLYIKFGWNWLSGSGEEIFFYISLYILNISLSHQIGEDLDSYMFCVMFNQNWPNGSGEEVENTDGLKVIRKS